MCEAIIKYPSRHYLKNLKALLKVNDVVAIEVKSRLWKNKLRVSINQFVENKGFSFSSSMLFLLNLRLFYSMLAMEANRFTLKCKSENPLIIIVRK